VLAVTILLAIRTWTLTPHRAISFRGWRSPWLGVWVLLLCCSGHGNGQAMQRRLSIPLMQTAVQDPAPRPQAAQPGRTEPDLRGSITGTVLDANGADLSGAQVALASSATDARTVITHNDGVFVFTGLPPGAFTLKISAAAMQPYVDSGLVLRSAQQLQLPPTLLAIAGVTTEVQVSVTQTELAQEQVKAAEKQRALGIFPNFYSSYIWKAEPLNKRQKFELALHSIADPVGFLATGVVAGAEQANNTFKGYGQGAQGYAKRYGAAYADDALGRMIGSAILPSLLHQDPRYFYKGSGTTWSRAVYAMSRAVITRGDNGKMQPNYSRVLGAFAAGGLSNLYHPAGDRGVGLTLSNALIDTAGSAAENLVREFLLRRITPGVPDHEQGKP
jgi:hypothetical protein